jgi:hypothetical protein
MPAVTSSLGRLGVKTDKSLNLHSNAVDLCQRGGMESLSGDTKGARTPLTSVSPFGSWTESDGRAVMYFLL